MSFKHRETAKITNLKRTVVWFLVISTLCILSIATRPADAQPLSNDKQDADKAAENEVKNDDEATAEKVAEKAVEKVVEKAVEKATEKAMEIVAVEESAKEELKAERPEQWRGSTEVHFTIFVVDIDEINDAAQNFTANVYIHLKWKDRRLASPEGMARQIPLEKVWNPGIIIANRQGIISRSLPEVVQVLPDGSVTYQQRYTGTMSQPLRLTEFPMDSHEFTIQFVAAGHSDNDLKFIPDVLIEGESEEDRIIGGSIAEELSLPDWKLVKHEALVLPYRPIPNVSAAGFAFRFQVERYFMYYVWQIVLPLSVVVLMSLAAFWVSRKQSGVRIGVATSSILTLIAHRFILASLLPRLPYMTRMDYFTVGSTLLVFFALIGVVYTSYLSGKEHEELSGKVDDIARIAFPAAFLLLLIWFISG